MAKGLNSMLHMKQLRPRQGLGAALKLRCTGCCGEMPLRKGERGAQPQGDTLHRSGAVLTWTSARRARPEPTMDLAAWRAM